MMKRAENADTVSTFAARYNVTAEFVIQSNQPALAGAAANRPLVAGNEYEVGGYFPGEPVPAIAPANDGFHWLIWETRYNAAAFQKSEKPVAYGLYAVPLDHRVEVVASETLPVRLAEAFFPGMSVDEVKAISNQTCRWRGASRATTKHGPNSTEEQAASRGQAVLHIPRMIVMPFNYFANDEGSFAIGGAIEMQILPGPAFRLRKYWPLWETASRSSISRLEPTTEAELQQRLNDPWIWRSRKAPDDSALRFPVEPFNLATSNVAECFSVKTGVRFLGSQKQGTIDGGGKDVLESNALLASMRSDWVEHVEATVGKDPQLIVLRELLTVTFPSAVQKTRDGYQIRDLSDLDVSKIYFPPLSIPFAGQSFVDAYNARSGKDPVTFTEFWRDAYAAAVGRAKAELLLRYGLQLTTPNPQNFLLEFDRATLEPTGTVVMRDIGDAKLHSEVIEQVGRDHPVIKYELDDPDRPGYLPAQTNNQGRADDHYAAEHGRLGTYPLDTRMHWHQYSSFKLQYGGKFLPERELTVIEWGRAHYAAYVGHLEAKLGVSFPALDDAILNEACGTIGDALNAEQTLAVATKRFNDAEALLKNSTIPKAVAARQEATAARALDVTPEQQADAAREARNTADQKKREWEAGPAQIPALKPYQIADLRKAYLAAEKIAEKALADATEAPDPAKVAEVRRLAVEAEAKAAEAEQAVADQQRALPDLKKQADEAADNPLNKGASKYRTPYLHPLRDMSVPARQYYRELVTSHKELEMAVDAEWILEAHADEKIHAVLTQPDTLARIKARWSTVWKK